MLADHIGVPQLRDLASRSERHSESIRIGSMQRLAELLFPGNELSDPKLDFRIKFLGGKQGFPEIEGHISGTLKLLCQRCLGGFDWDVDLDFRLIVIRSEGDLSEVAEPFDAVVAGEHGICLLDVVEDELLASLPLAPMHDKQDVCNPSAEIETVDDGAVAPEPKMTKPFGNLAELMKSADSSNSNKLNKKS